jgi:hypothetical protein
MKLKIIEMETDVQKAKSTYNEALQNLEKISDEIHKLREDQKLNYMTEDEVKNLEICDCLISNNIKSKLFSLRS